ncbi:recombinase family protein [Kitasatospora sp. NPDC004723]|uniref:recombinase family protein n=1 Tax=Kitasatospora sp. NPDC004723 TaxID=3154288 RepID=UPI0033B7BD96
MHDPHQPVYRPVRRSAMYLRCRPYDPHEADYVRSAMEQLAQRLGLPYPDVYADHGLSTRGPLPALASLLTAAERGWLDVVLVPGPFVFSLDDRAAADTVRRLARAGCEVVEAPGRVIRPAAPPWDSLGQLRDVPGSLQEVPGQLRDAPGHRHLAGAGAAAPLPDGGPVVYSAV